MEIAQIEFFRQKIETTVTRFFESNHRPNLVYHNLEHTQKVVAHTDEIAAYYALTDLDRFILFAAAWWHDTGQLMAEPAVHEEKSVELVSAFFALNPGVPAEVIVTIERAILGTKMPQVPCSLVEEILCDADTYHLGTDEFRITNNLVLQEAVLRTGKRIDNWTESTLRMMRRHHFHTEYCLRLLNEGKAENIASLERLEKDAGQSRAAS